MVDDDSRSGSGSDRQDTVPRPTNRSKESSLKRWFFFDGDRTHVTAGLLLGVFVSLLLLGVIWPIEYRRLLSETTMIESIFDTLLGGVILLVSIVVAVASVGISQELTSLGDQHERIDVALDFRNSIEELSEVDMSPARPREVIIVLLRAIRQRAEDLDTTVPDSPESEFQEDIDRLINDIDTNIEEIADTLDRVDPGSTDELLVGLDYDCSWQLHQTLRIRRKYADQLSEDQLTMIQDLAEALHEFMTSREYFKTLYYQHEFSDLSTTLLTVSLPVIIFITYVLLALDAGLFPEINFLPISPLAVFISLAYTIALGPYVTLTAYVFRATSVTKRTSAVGPFVLKTDRELAGDSDVLRAESERDGTDSDR